MNLLSFGCSLILGTDLSDDGKHGPWSKASNLTWPALLAGRYNLPYNCRARGGSGNLCILDRVLGNAVNFHDTIFVIGWTYIDRFDYSYPNGKHFGGSHMDYLTLRPAEENDLEKIYYRHLHSDYRDKLTNLIYIKTAIDFLQQREIPFVMTCVDDSLFGEKWHASPHICELQQMIKPHITYFEGRNFVDWSRHRGFDVSATGHPLEEAHRTAAELVAPAIDAILRRA